jgi:hypothetical protein
MDGEHRGGRVRTFLLGGLVGASAAVAAAQRRREVLRRRSDRRDSPPGLAAFEAAPCYRELVQREHEGVAP